jgi:hypothetical protein
VNDVDDPTLADLEQAMIDAAARLGRVLELESEAWEHMTGARSTVTEALHAWQLARQRYVNMRANPRPAR